MRDCSKLDQIYSVFLHIFILFGVLCLLFLLVVSKLESAAFHDEIRSLLNDKFLPLLKQKGNEQLKTDLRSINLGALADYYSKPSDKVTISNTSLQTIMIIINVALLILIIMMSILAKQCLDFRQIGLENGVLFVLIGIFEYVFFQNIAKKYVPVLPSTFERTLYAHLGES